MSKAKITKQFLGKVVDSFKTKGVAGGIEDLRVYKAPLKNLSKTPPKQFNLPEEQISERMRDLPGRSFRATLGNSADSIARLREGGIKNLPRNAYNLVKDQIRGERYVEIGADKVIKGTNKTRNNFGLGQYDIVSKTNRNTVIAKRSRTGQTLNLALGVNPGVIGVGDYWATSEDKTKSKARRAAEALGTAAVGTISVPAALIGSGIKNYVGHKKNRSKNVV